MSEDYFEIAYINFDEAILHGQKADGSRVRIALSAEQAKAVQDLGFKHDSQMQKLLREMAS